MSRDVTRPERWLDLLTSGTHTPRRNLRRPLEVDMVQNLLKVTELGGEMRASLQAINDKIDRLLALQEKVERNSQAIVRLKTVWSFVAAGIALVVAVLKDWLFGQK